MLSASDGRTALIASYDFGVESVPFPANTAAPMFRPRPARSGQGRLSRPTLTCLLLFCLGLLAGCRESRVDWATREKILLLGNGAEPKALDPHLVTSVGDSNILRALFEGLVVNHISDDSLHEPGVAERWESNETFTKWRFHLRPDAKWSNGDPVTAHDFVYAYQRILHPEMGAPYASMLYFLKNAQAFNEGKLSSFEEVGVRAVHDHELLCVLENPTPYFPDVVKHTTWLPVHRATIEAFGPMTQHYTDWQKPGHHVGNGAFRLADWRINAHVKVERNPHYWNAEQVKLNGIHFYPIESTFTEEKAFRNGLIHLTYTLPQNLIDHYRARQDDLLNIDPYAGVYYFHCNVRSPPTDNPDFRRALAYAIQRETITRYVTMGGQQPTYAFTPPSETGYDPPRVLSYDPDKAREYLRKAGYASGADVPEFVLFINTSEAHKDIAMAVQDMWKKTLGIEKVRIENQEWKVFQESVRAKQYQIARAGWIADYADPSTFLNLWTTGDSNNHTGWSNPEYDRLIRESASLSNPEERYARFAEAERILLDELPVLPLYWYTRVYLKHPDVRNWHPLLLDNRPYQHIKLIPSR